ncbi:MAG TPA: hypothetical protein VGS41_03620 [Chthonomonadales bacterium]|nr:hypothetical protein [Chthonomonadales bacterium]
MDNINALGKRDAAKFALIAGGAVGAVVTARLLGARKDNVAERLATALLNTQPLKDAPAKDAGGNETTLAACAAYLIEAAFHAGEGLGVASAKEDPVGRTRTQRHPFTNASVTVFTEAESPERAITYSVTIPGAGEVRGSKRIGSLRMSGIAPARPTPDTLLFNLENGYSAQGESEFEVAEYLVTGKVRLYGSATLRDNYDNVARINIGFDGSVSGAITRAMRVIGRFTGSTTNGVQFKQYEISGANA